MEINKVKTELLEASALPQISHLESLPNDMILDQMMAHREEFLDMAWESIRNDPMTPDHMLGVCYSRYCDLLERFKDELKNGAP